MASREAPNIPRIARDWLAGLSQFVVRPKGSSSQVADACRFRGPRVACFRGHRFAEEMTLPFVTAVGFDLSHLLFGFDAFRNHRLVEACAESGDRSRRGCCGGSIETRKACARSRF